jgi:hypothetical protein
MTSSNITSIFAAIHQLIMPMNRRTRAHGPLERGLPRFRPRTERDAKEIGL